MPRRRWSRRLSDEAPAQAPCWQAPTRRPPSAAQTCGVVRRYRHRTREPLLARTPPGPRSPRRSTNDRARVAVLIARTASASSRSRQPVRRRRLRRRGTDRLRELLGRVAPGALQSTRSRRHSLATAAPQDPGVPAGGPRADLQTVSRPVGKQPVDRRKDHPATWRGPLPVPKQMHPALHAGEPQPELKRSARYYHPSASRRVRGAPGAGHLVATAVLSRVSTSRCCLKAGMIWSGAEATSACRSGRRTPRKLASQSGTAASCQTSTPHANDAHSPGIFNTSPNPGLKCFTRQCGLFKFINTIKPPGRRAGGAIFIGAARHPDCVGPSAMPCGMSLCAQPWPSGVVEHRTGGGAWSATRSAGREFATRRTDHPSPARLRFTQRRSVVAPRPCSMDRPAPSGGLARQPIQDEVLEGLKAAAEQALLWRAKVAGVEAGRCRGAARSSAVAVGSLGSCSAACGAAYGSALPSRRRSRRLVCGSPGVRGTSRPAR